MKKNIFSIILIIVAVLSVSTFADTTDGDQADMNNSGDQADMFQSQMNGFTSTTTVTSDPLPKGTDTQINRFQNNTDLADKITVDNGNGIPKLSLKGLVAWLGDLMNQLIYVIIGASLVMFLFGIFKLSFVDGQKPEAREQSRKFMFWGIVALFVMVSVWGLVQFLQTTFFNGSPLTIPTLK